MKNKVTLVMSVLILEFRNDSTLAYRNKKSVQLTTEERSFGTGLLEENLRGKYPKIQIQCEF